MYSVVLATMLVAGGSTPAWHNCHSCYSGYSGYSCYSGYSGYSGYGCCHSYPGYRIFPSFHHCHSYCSSCYCSGPVYYSCSSCYSSSSCYTCCSSSVIVSPGPRVIPVPGTTPEVEALRREVERLRKALEKSEKLPNPNKKADGEISTSAKISRVTITLPASARLWIENVECPLTSSVRTFDTPPLSSNQQYFYNVKMEVMRDGQLVSQTQRAIITPGQPVQVDFNTALTTASR